MRRLTEELCPICGAPGDVRSLGAFGFAAHCSSCYEGDPEAGAWRRLQGHGESAEDAVAAWLEDARELCSVDEIPTLPCPCRPSTPSSAMFLDLEIQVRCEAALQQGLDLVPGWRFVPDDSTPLGRRAQDIIYAEFSS